MCLQTEKEYFPFLLSSLSLSLSQEPFPLYPGESLEGGTATSESLLPSIHLHVPIVLLLLTRFHTKVTYMHTRALTHSPSFH